MSSAARTGTRSGDPNRLWLGTNRVLVPKSEGDGAVQAWIDLLPDP
jgi:hypothetical protein